MGPYSPGQPVPQDGDLPQASPGIGHNAPPTPFDERAARTEEIIAVGEAWNQVTAIESEAQASRLADQLELVATAAKENEKARRAEVDPLNAQVKEISGRYKRLGAGENLSGVDPASFLGIMAAHLKKLKAGWLAELDRRKAEAEKKAREEADKKAREAEEAERNAKSIADRIAAEDARKAADAAAKEADQVASTKVALKGEIGSRAAGFRTVMKATAIINLDDAIAYYKARPEVAELLLRLASADARAGRKRVPGFRIEQVRSV